MNGLTPTDFHNAFGAVNKDGYASLMLPDDLIKALGEPLYQALDNAELPSKRSDYYNELALFWPEDWEQSTSALADFHDSDTIKQIHPASHALAILEPCAGKTLSRKLIDFTRLINQRVVQNHHGLKNNLLRLSRVMVRQMNEHHCTRHAGSVLHEDQGYRNKPLRQLISVVVTTYGTPTLSAIHTANVGELLMFNARDRREELGLPMNKAFLHRGPVSGPKMFLFFEFLGPSLT